MTFVRRRIELAFEFGKGTFGEEGAPNRVDLTDHRVHCSVQQVIGPGMGQARVRVYGLKPSLLNELASLNQATEAVRMNKIIVKAGDEGTVLATVFEGQISLSQFDMNASPDVVLNIMAFAGALQAVKTAEASSYPGSADAATILFNLAQKAGLFFENEGGASKVLSTPVYEGAYRQQIEDCARAAGFGWTIENNTLAIWPAGGSRGGQITVVSPETGMVGYPGYATGNNGGILAVKTIFNPQLSIANRVRIESSLKVANGVWTVWNLAHELDSDTPGGQWLTTFDGSPYGA